MRKRGFNQRKGRREKKPDKTKMYRAVVKETTTVNVQHHGSHSSSEVKGFSIATLVLLGLAYLFFTIWFGIEFSASGAVRTGTDGFVGLWSPIILYHAVVGGLGLVFFWSYYSIVKNTPDGSAIKAMYMYPRYAWDTWSWLSFTFGTFGLTLSISIILAISIGLDFNPDYSSVVPAVFGSTLCYRNLYIVMSTISLLNFLSTFGVWYTYIAKVYPLRTVDDLKSNISDTALIDLKNYNKPQNVNIGHTLVIQNS